jgi:hypothetical protein
VIIGVDFLREGREGCALSKKLFPPPKEIVYLCPYQNVSALTRK